MLYNVVLVSTLRPSTSAIHIHLSVTFWISFPVKSLQSMGVPRWLTGEESSCQSRRHGKHGFNPRVRKIPWRRKWPPTPVFLPGKPHGQRSLAGHSAWACKELDATEQARRPVLYSKFTLVFYFVPVIDNLYASIPINQFIPLASFSFGVHAFILYSYVSISTL